MRARDVAIRPRGRPYGAQGRLACGHAGDGGRGAVVQHRDARGGGLARVGARGGDLDAPGGPGEPFYALGAPHCASFRPFMGSEWSFLTMNLQNRPQLARLIIK